MKTRTTSVTSGAVAAIILCLVGVACQAFKGQLPVADDAINEFHYKYNNDKFDELAAERHQKMKDNESDEQYATDIRGIKAKFGAVKSSAYVTSKSSDLGEKLNVERDTVFEKGTAREKFLFEIQDGKAVLLGYTLSSHDLLK